VRLRLPSAELLAAAPHLASLAIAEAALAVAARAIRAAYSDADRAFHLGEPVELTTARTLVDECDALLLALDDHRGHLLARLRRAGVQNDKPL